MHVPLSIYHNYTEFSIIIKFSQILGGEKLNLGGGNPGFPPLCMKPCPSFHRIKQSLEGKSIRPSYDCQAGFQDRKYNVLHIFDGR